MSQANEKKLRTEVAHFLATGESDPAGMAGGGTIIESLTTYDRRLRGALLQEVKKREHGLRPPEMPKDFVPRQFTRGRIEPMVAALFPAAERTVVLDVAERSIVFLTAEATHTAIQEVDYLHTAWQIANIYLDSLQARPLGVPQRVLGLNESQVCYVSTAYFSEDDPFADYVVHEVAHIFHNCKRASLGLRYTRSKEWLLDIAFGKRETFAYACEAYSRIIAQGRTQNDRQKLLRQYCDKAPVGDDRVETTELTDILAGAITRRNGWKLILERCTNSKPHQATTDQPITAAREVLGTNREATPC